MPEQEGSKRRIFFITEAGDRSSRSQRGNDLHVGNDVIGGQRVRIAVTAAYMHARDFVPGVLDAQDFVLETNVTPVSSRRLRNACASW